MGFKRFFDNQLNLLVTKIEGEISDQNLLEHVKELNDECKGIVGLRELADCRGITTMDPLSVMGTTMAAAAQENRPDSLLAILVRPDDPVLFGLARAFQTFSEEVRREVVIFTDLDDCISWLVGEDEREAAISDFFKRLTE